MQRQKRLPEYGLLAIPTVGQATTVSFVQNTQGCTGNCGIDTANTVQVSDTKSPTDSTPLAPGFFDIFVTLDTSVTSGGKPWVFMTDPNGQGHDASFGFACSINNMALTLNTATDFTVHSIVTLGSFVINPYKWDTTGNYGYGVNAGHKPPGGPTALSVLDFNVNTGTSDDLTTFLKTLLASSDGTNAIFAADVYSGLTGKTGAIGFIECGPPSGTSCPSHQNEVPIPGALWLFGTVLTGAAGVGGWRRKKRNASAIIAA
jgi:hypothetical protein